MGTVLYVTAEAVRQVAILAQALTPDAAGKLLDQLAVPEDARDFAHLGAAGRLQAGVALPKPQPVFPRFIEQDEKQAAQ
jgi:methionyl-tRNA synthetase